MKDKRELLKCMQTQNNANSQVIHQTIVDVKRESVQLEWSLTEPSNPLSSFNISNTAINTS